MDGSQLDGVLDGSTGNGEPAIPLTQLLHDVQTSTQALLNTAENLQEELTQRPSLDPREFAREVQSLVYRVLELSNVLHSLQAGEYLGAYKYSDYPLTLLVQWAVQTFQAFASNRSVSFDLSRVKHLSVRVSDAHAKVLLGNLIHNAIKYSYRKYEDHERTVRISASEDADFAKLKISNYGVGILSEEALRIFTPGFRGAQAQAEGRTGSGMGLFTARKIAEEMGGRLTIESTQVGQGNRSPYLTVATLYLPCSRTNQ